MSRRRRILYVQYTNPARYPPLEHSSRILAGRGWRVLFLSIRRFKEDPVLFPAHPGISVRELPYCRPGLRQKLHYLAYSLWVIVSAWVWRPRWVYISDALSCPAALALTYMPWIKILYHEHDSPNAGEAIHRLVLWARRRVVDRAAVCVIPNEERAWCFQEERQPGKRLFCVWNCPSVEEVSEQRASMDPGPLRLYYHGSLHPERLPWAVIRAVMMLEGRVHLLIVGYAVAGEAGYPKKIRAEADRAGLSRAVEIEGPFPRRQMRERMSHCDVGLSLLPKESEDANVVRMVGASNKTFDYLAGGLAVLVPDFPGWVETFVKPGYGLPCDPGDPESIRRALERFLNHPAETREMGEKGRRRVLAEWNYERQFLPVVEAMEGTQ